MIPKKSRNGNAQFVDEIKTTRALKDTSFEK